MLEPGFKTKLFHALSPIWSPRHLSKPKIGQHWGDQSKQVLHPKGMCSLFLFLPLEADPVTATPRSLIALFWVCWLGCLPWASTLPGCRTFVSLCHLLKGSGSSLPAGLSWVGQPSASLIPQMGTSEPRGFHVLLGCPGRSECTGSWPQQAWKAVPVACLLLPPSPPPSQHPSLSCVVCFLHLRLNSRPRVCFWGNPKQHDHHLGKRKPTWPPSGECRLSKSQTLKPNVDWFQSLWSFHSATGYKSEAFGNIIDLCFLGC